MNLASVMQSERKLLVPTYDRHKILLQAGSGMYLRDSNGKKYLDFLSGIGVNALGYHHPAVQKTLKQQAARLIHVSNLFYHEYQSELARRLVRISGLERTFFCNSGTEAWEGALKFARAYARSQNHNGHKPKWRVLALGNSFHGRTFGSLATTGQAKYREPFAPLMPGVSFVAFNDTADLKKKFDVSVCAVCVEVIQGEGGIRPVSAEFLQLARKLTKASGALLLVDEIQSGLGRTGHYFAYQHHRIQPDIVTVAKPLAAGLPLGAILTTNRVANALHPGMHGSTFGGGPLACAVAIEFLRVLDSLLVHVRKTSEYFVRQLNELKSKHNCIRDVRGLGLMLGIELDTAERAKAAVSQMMEQGIIINRTNENTLRFLPPYIIEKKHIDQLICTLDAVLSSGTPEPAKQLSTISRSTRRKNQI